MKLGSTENTYQRMEYGHCINNHERVRNEDVENSLLVDDIDFISHTGAEKEDKKNVEREQNHTGVLKRCLVSLGIATGVIALAGAGYGVYRLGRSFWNESALLPFQQAGGLTEPVASPIMIGDGVPENLGMVTVPAFTSSPYAYYEKQYVSEQTTSGSQTERVMSREDIATTTTGPRLSTACMTATLPPASSTAMTVNRHIRLFGTDSPLILGKENRHASQRAILYHTLHNDETYGLFKQVRRDLDTFFVDDIHHIIFTAYRAPLEKRIIPLREIATLIECYKEYITESISSNEHKTFLLPEEHAREIVLEEKLIMLYITAECIINHLNESSAYSLIFYDNKTYSTNTLCMLDEKIKKIVEEDGYDGMLE